MSLVCFSNSHNQIDRKYLAKTSQAKTETAEGEQKEGASTADDDDDEVLMAKLTKFIYNCENAGR